MSSHKVILDITRMQQMHLLDLVIEFLQESDVRTFSDYSTTPERTVSVGEVLHLITDAHHIEISIGGNLWLVPKK